MTLEKLKAQIQKYKKLADRYNLQDNKEMYNYYIGKWAAYVEMSADVIKPEKE